MNSNEHAAWGRIGGLRNYARHGGRAMTAGARRAFEEKFERAVDPHRELDDGERIRRAEAARRAHMLKLAARSAAARAARRLQVDPVGALTSKKATASKEMTAAATPEERNALAIPTT